MKNDAQNHNKTKDKKYVEEKRSQFMALVDISKRAGETIPFKVFVEMVDAFIRQLAKELKPRVSRKFVGKVTARIYCDRKSSEAIKTHIQNAFKEIDVEVEE